METDTPNIHVHYKVDKLFGFGQLVLISLCVLRLKLGEKHSHDPGRLRSRIASLRPHILILSVFLSLSPLQVA